MDSLDPLTEIIKTGNASSLLIGLERILWLSIGLFFLSAVASSITKSMKENDWFGKKSFLTSLKATNDKGKDKVSYKISDDKK